MMKRALLPLWIASVLSVSSLPGWTLVPPEVAIVYNEEPTLVNASRGTALYYRQARDVPPGNLIALQTSAEEYLSANRYLNEIATPISNYLSTHPNIKVIVLCYGVPSRIARPSDQVGFDSALMLVGNPGFLTTQHWARAWTNPYYGANTDFATFRGSPANVVPGITGPNGEPWHVNYLVCRLDGYATPTTTVTIDTVNYTIPTDVKALIDRAHNADAAGRTGLTDAIAVLDDAPGDLWTYSSELETSLNSLLAPVTGHENNNVWHEGMSAYAMNKQNVIAYSSGGSYDYVAAGSVTTWWRPFNTWKDGAIGVFWNVSGDGYSIRTPDYIHFWYSQRDTQDVEAHTLKATWERFGGVLETSSLYDGHWLCLYDFQTHSLLKRVHFDSGVARMDLSDVAWPSHHQTYIELRFPDDDPNHAGERIDRAVMDPYDIYNNREAGYTWRFGFAQSLAGDLIREGCSGTTGNVGEPGGGCTAHPHVVLPRYLSGYTWAESAWDTVPLVDAGSDWRSADGAVGRPSHAVIRRSVPDERRTRNWSRLPARGCIPGR